MSTTATSSDDLHVKALLVQNLPIVFVSALLYYLYNTYYAAGLNRYSGPLLAHFGKLWHWLDVRSNRHQLNLVDLHRKYGDVVRIGPTTLSVSNPEYVSKIYGISAGLWKSDMYDIFAPRINGKILPSLLGARDPKDHAVLHKPMAKEFAMSVVSEYEPLVDVTLRKWMVCLQQRFCEKPNQVCDMALWLRLFATETIMDVTFSESMGFLEKGSDVGGFLETLDIDVDSVGLLAVMPWTANLWRHNPMVGIFKKDNNMLPNWAAKRITDRMAARAEGKSTGLKDSKGRDLRDFLDRFLDASPTTTPPFYDFTLVINWCLVNIVAGGDTTAIGLGSTVYHLLKSPTKHAKLVEELRNAKLDVPVAWKDCQNLPYLDGCIREGLRLHPSIGLGLERDGGGLQMPDGYILPGNAKVSINPWVMNRQAEVFGELVDEFIPERWLQREGESSDGFRERINRMKRVEMTFGAGSRACTGKHIALLEMYKAIATLFSEFELSLENPNEEWIAVNRWATRLSNIRCRIKRV